MKCKRFFRVRLLLQYQPVSFCVRVFVKFVVLLGVVSCSTEETIIENGRISVFERGQALLGETASQTISQQDLPTPVINSTWTQIGGIASTLVGNLDLVPSPQQMWVASGGTKADSTLKILSVPIVAGDFVFVYDSTSHVTALHTENGERAWRVDVRREGEEGEAIGGGISWENNRLYVSTGYAELLALDGERGEILWRRLIPTPPRGAPTVKDGKIYLSTIDSRTIAFRGEDGSISWEYTGLIEQIGLLKSSSPSTDGEVLIVGSAAGEVVALNANTGAFLWSDAMNTSQSIGVSRILPDILGQPVIVGQTVYVVGHGGLLVAIDIQQGIRLWERELSGIHTPWIAGDILYVLTTRNELAALHRQDGRVLWVSQLQTYEEEDDKEGRILWNGPVLAGNTLWLTSTQGELVGLEAVSGQVLLRRKLSAAAYLPPIVANQTLYTLTEDAMLTAFR